LCSVIQFSAPSANATSKGLNAKDGKRASLLDSAGDTAAEFGEGVVDWFNTVGNDLVKLYEGLSEGRIEWALGGLPPHLGGGAVSIARNLASISVRFGSNANQFGHAWRHVVARGHDPVAVQGAILNDIARRSVVKVGQSFQGSVTVNGATIGYSAFRRSRGQISVGSIRPPK